MTIEYRAFPPAPSDHEHVYYGPETQDNLCAGMVVLVIREDGPEHVIIDAYPSGPKERRIRREWLEKRNHNTL